MTRIFAIVGLVVTVLLFSPQAWGEQRVSERDRLDISRIETYLSALKTLRSKFVQLSSGGRFAEGNIYIERPKKMRLEYTRPSNIHVYVKGSWLAHVDTELEAVWHVPLKTTPASFLMRDRVKLSGEVTVSRVLRNAKTLSIEIVQTEEPEAGKFEMTFSDEPLSLRKWVVTDAQGIDTSVTLIAPEFNVVIPRRLFVLDETKFEREVQ